MGAIASIAAVVHSARAVVRVATALFALGSFAVFVGAGGRRHARPPVTVPTEESRSGSGNTTPAVGQPDTEREPAV